MHQSGTSCPFIKMFTTLLGGECVIFALDCSSTVSDDNLEKEIHFVQQLAQSWNVSMEVKVIVYGHDAETLSLAPGNKQLFYYRLQELRSNWAGSKNRRIDFALNMAAQILTTSAQPAYCQQVVILVTAGGQQSDAQKKEEDHELLLDAQEKLSNESIKVILVPVGLHTDFRELGLIVKRPQSLYPLSGFNAMTPDRAQSIVDNIKKTLGECRCRFAFNYM